MVPPLSLSTSSAGRLHRCRSPASPAGQLGVAHTTVAQPWLELQLSPERRRTRTTTRRGAVTIRTRLAIECLQTSLGCDVRFGKPGRTSRFLPDSGGAIGTRRLCRFDLELRAVGARDL